MKVYIIRIEYHNGSGNMMDSHICKVFKDKLKAEEYCDKLNNIMEYLWDLCDTADDYCQLKTELYAKEYDIWNLYDYISSYGYDCYVKDYEVEE